MRARAAASRATKLLDSVVLTTYSNIDETHDLLRHPAPPLPTPARHEDGASLRCQMALPPAPTPARRSEVTR